MNIDKIMNPPKWWSVTYRVLYAIVYAVAGIAASAMAFAHTAEQSISAGWWVVALLLAFLAYVVGSEAYRVATGTDED